MNECKSSPCKSGTTCSDSSQKQSTPIDRYTCSCVAASLMQFARLTWLSALRRRGSIVPRGTVARRARRVCLSARARALRATRTRPLAPATSSSTSLHPTCACMPALASATRSRTAAGARAATAATRTRATTTTVSRRRARTAPRARTWWRSSCVTCAATCFAACSAAWRWTPAR